ncbi:hypothetical protein RvY_15376 [Ramazzottius varieornatus]|uniref:Queuine tRNA-ribosyltransferase accessory subunit 2 n=1 Tax=Ramazzottius varieornatus TaxID=947166 RepID=A0A1D1VZE6_RAMVA|nr:hypothetical protein RvY_15376 [Ramazzottius varieornatus]
MRYLFALRSRMTEVRQKTDFLRKEMEFSVNEVSSSEFPVIRRGVLKLRGQSGQECQVETPGCFFHTHFGSIPHLTPDDLQYVKDSLSCIPLNMTLSTASVFADALAGYEKSVGAFVGYPSSVVYMSLHDPLVPLKPAMNEKATIGIWNRTGKKKLTPEQFMDMQDKLKPDSVQIMCDMDTEMEGSSNQRLTKSYDSSLRWLDRCLELMKDRSSHYPVLATVGGGSDPWRRKNFCLEAANRKVDGFVIDGFGSGWIAKWKEWEVTGSSLFGPHEALIRESIRSLPKDKPRFIHAPLSPTAVVQLVRMGVDVFDTSYPAALADRGQALIRTGDFCFEVWTMSEKGYFDDLTSLSTRCGCYTCEKYTRAYIHHLIACEEINAGVLLMIHNLNEYLKFFRDIRKSMDEGKFHLWMPQAEAGRQQADRD